MDERDPARDLAKLTQRREAFELRLKGHTWDEVAEQVGFASRSGAFQAVKALLKESQTLTYDEISLWREESLTRHTMLLKEAMKYALAGDEKMMREARLILGAIDDLTGARAPVRVEIGESDVDRAIRELEAELDRRSREAARETPADQDAPG